ncbi:MAG: hypothetical protein CYPHOPRED_001853 [Cyphobasidiales sp. Tagirdzhanova-0007]|nr:MAG: hypothetical protein CYPHOPRED_001853 [Cyphobasidiales sp. Tagirdzhanova-0007]
MGEEIDTSALSALDCFLSGVYARVMELDLCLPDTGRGANFSLGLPAVFWSVVLLPPLIEETLVFPPLDELSALSLAAVEKLLAGELDAAGPGPPSGLSSIPPLEIGELPGPFDYSARHAYTQIPNPGWQIGQGLPEEAPRGVDKDVYELFNQSRTVKGQEELFKRIDPDETPPSDLYKLMIGGIVPRPIAFCSSLDEKGVANLAPFSYFQAAGHQPPMITLYFTGIRDSCANIKRTKEFTISIISEPFIEASNYSAINLPANMSEWASTGLTQAPSKLVKPPRVAESAYSMECELEHFYDVGLLFKKPRRATDSRREHRLTCIQIRHPKEPEKITGVSVLARVKLFHVRSDTLTERGSIDLSRLLPVSRLGGISYGRTTAAYEMPRPEYKEEQNKPAFQEALQKGDRHTAGTTTGPL